MVLVPTNLYQTQQKIHSPKYLQASWEGKSNLVVATTLISLGPRMNNQNYLIVIVLITHCTMKVSVSGLTNFRCREPIKSNSMLNLTNPSSPKVKFQNRGQMK